MGARRDSKGRKESDRNSGDPALQEPVCVILALTMVPSAKPQRLYSCNTTIGNNGHRALNTLCMKSFSSVCLRLTLGITSKRVIIVLYFREGAKALTG